MWLRLREIPVPCHPAEDRPADRAQNRANAYNQPSHFSFPATELQGARPDSPVTQRAGPYHRQRPGKGHEQRRREPTYQTAGEDLLVAEDRMEVQPLCREQICRRNECDAGEHRRPHVAPASCLETRR
jgi:hypothetical protein